MSKGEWVKIIGAHMVLASLVLIALFVAVLMLWVIGSWVADKWDAVWPILSQILIVIGALIYIVLVCISGEYVDKYWKKRKKGVESEYFM